MPRTSAEKAWIGVGLIAGLLLVLVGYLFFVGPQRSSTDDVDGQVVTAQSQNDTLQARINALNAQNRKLSTYQAALKQAQLALPSSSDLPDFLRSLQSLGSATLADVTTLTVGTPAPVTQNGTASGSAASPSPTPTPASSTAPTGPALYALPITAQVSGTIAQLTDFLGQLQSSQPRAVLVSAVALTGSTTGGKGASSTMDVTMQAFVAPGSLAETQQLAQAASK